MLEKLLENYVTYSTIARDVGLEIYEVSTLLAEHDVPVVRVQSANMVERTDYLAIKPVLVKTRKNKIRRAQKSASA